MNPWADLLRRPARLTQQAAADWFSSIADHLLNRTQLVVAGRRHRLTEIEFYYRGPGHEDPFTHGDPIQIHPGLWYFHKTSGVFRGGTYKGVDLTFGDGTARAGILLRGLETEDRVLIDGPSLLVDHLLRLCERQTVAELHGEIGGRPAWDVANPLHLAESPNLGRDILACARVGLTLRRARARSAMPTFLTRPYRFLTKPADIAKGKVQMVLGLHRRGCTHDEIQRVTGCPKRTIHAYIAEYESGFREGQFEDYSGKELGLKDLCRLHGIADRR